jgi:X-X-X-Leu-X-X-Gly heptad repeat protein
MAQQNGLPMLFAGIGIGVAAAFVLMDSGVRSRLGNAVRSGSERVAGTLSDAEQALNNGAKAMSDASGKLKNGIDQAAAATKNAVDQVAARSREAAHQAGDQLERGAHRLQNA